MLRFYGFQSLQAVLDLRIRQFWMLSKNIDRLAAEEDQRQLMVLAAAQSSEGFQSFVEERRKIIGTIVDYDQDKVGAIKVKAAQEERDREGLMALKSLGRLG